MRLLGSERTYCCQEREELGGMSVKKPDHRPPPTHQVGIFVVDPAQGFVGFAPLLWFNNLALGTHQFVVVSSASHKGAFWQVTKKMNKSQVVPTRHFVYKISNSRRRPLPEMHAPARDAKIPRLGRRVPLPECHFGFFFKSIFS